MNRQPLDRLTIAALFHIRLTHYALGIPSAGAGDKAGSNREQVVQTIPAFRRAVSGGTRLEKFSTFGQVRLKSGIARDIGPTHHRRVRARSRRRCHR